MPDPPPADLPVWARSLRRRLALQMPGESFMTDMAPMAPHGRGFLTEADALCRGAARAAALVLLYPAGASATVHVALTERAPGLRHHAGQVSLPGGAMEPGEDVVRAALREAGEELDIAPAGVAVLGCLTPLYIAPSDFVVYPVVGAAHRRPEFRPNPVEVAALVEAPIDTFVGTSHRTTAWRVSLGTRRLVPVFAVGGCEIWGATAMMLAELGAVWADARRGVEDAGPEIRPHEDRAGG